MLSKLKAECWPKFTVKLEGMFRDMKLSVDTMQAYRVAAMRPFTGIAPFHDGARTFILSLTRSTRSQFQGWHIPHTTHVM